MPCSIALWAASSAASCAANGVDLREPLKPFTPADDQATTLPETSVIVTMVLLNDAVMCAMPLWMFFLTFLTLGFDLAASGAPAPPDCSAMTYAPVLAGAAAAGLEMLWPLRGPLRVRALVCVR